MHKRYLAIVVGLLSSPLDAQILQPGAPYPFGPPVAAGDVDGDGRDDYFVQATSGPVVSGRTGLALAHLAHATGLYYAAGDCNADGCDDLVLIDSGIATVRSGADGSTLFQVTTSTLGTNLIRGQEGADFDGDGCSDVLLQAAPNYYLECYSGRTGTRLFTKASSSNTRYVLGDWNGDGHPDLASYMDWPPVVMSDVLLGVSFAVQPLNGSLLSPAPYPLGDLDGNGTSDLARPGPAGLTLTDGLSSTVLGTLPGGSALPWGDLDGDGHHDFRYTPGVAGVADGICSGATLTVFPHSLSTSGNIASPCAGDLDGDGRAEGYTVVSFAPHVAEWFDPAVPLTSRTVRRGASGVTSIGHRPRLRVRGHAGLGGTLRFDCVGLQGAGAAVLSVGTAVDIDLAGLGAPGNRLYAAPESLYLLSVDSTGLAQRVFTVPNSPTTLGATLSVQAAAVDPAANALGLVTGNAIDLAVHN